jgi:predicted transcriptional regulator
MAKSD